MSRICGQENLAALTTGDALALPAYHPGVQGVGTMQAEPLRRTVIIRNPQGFHVRPAAALAERARQYQSKVSLIRGDVKVDGRQVLDLIMLAAEQGAEITLEVIGPDAGEALEALAQILGAEEPPPLPVRPLPQKG